MASHVTVTFPNLSQSKQSERQFFMDYNANFADTERQLTVLREELERAIAPLQEKIRETIKLGMVNAVTMFFDKFPKVRTIYWSQYIPYFNDGDPCVFSVGDICFNPCEHEEIEFPHWGDDQDEDENADFSSYGKNASPELIAAMNEFEKFLHGIDDYLEERYGANAFIKLHRDGDWFEEYEPPY